MRTSGIQTEGGGEPYDNPRNGHADIWGRWHRGFGFYPRKLSQVLGEIRVQLDEGGAVDRMLTKRPRGSDPGLPLDVGNHVLGEHGQGGLDHLLAGAAEVAPCRLAGIKAIRFPARAAPDRVGVSGRFRHLTASLQAVGGLAGRRNRPASPYCSTRRTS